MKLRAYADDIYGLPTIGRNKRRRRAGLSPAEFLAICRRYDWERLMPGLERSLDAFCAGVILLAILYFVPMLFFYS